MNRMAIALQNLEAARRHTNRLLAATPEECWFTMPAGSPTHIAWQVGHMAMAEYKLLLDRIRGVRADDNSLISTEFLQAFARLGTPSSDKTKYPEVSKIRQVFDAVHAQVMRDLPSVPDAELDEPLTNPHPICKTKFEALSWCPLHEGTHAGQIGLLRRLVGLEAIW